MTQQMLADLLMQVLYPLALAVGAYLIRVLRRWHINDITLKAIANGAGAAYMTLVQSREGLTPQAIEAAVIDGASYVERRIPGTLPKAGFDTTAQVEQAVRAHLGKLLAVDPTVSPEAPLTLAPVMETRP